MTVNDILAKPENWGDVDHLNMYGAAELSARVGSLLTRSIAAQGQTSLPTPIDETRNTTVP